MSGGSGSRLWPLSRHNRPKQFLSFEMTEPMIVETSRRMSGEGFAAPTVLCNADHRFLVAEGLREADISLREIILEPVGRNTAAAIAVAAISIHEAAGDSPVLVMPSDHVIRAVDCFRSAVGAALPAVEAGRIVTFGVKPTRPETGYGYIEHGEALDGGEVLSIARFHEKPDADTAAQYAKSGEFSWNAGIFFFRTSVVLDAFQTHAPEILDQVRRALDKATSDLDFIRLDEATFAEAPAAPFDIAIMEKTDRGAVIPVDMGWNDVGSWRSLWEEFEKDDNGNVCVGDVVLENTRDSLAWSTEGIVTALVGVTDVAVVNSGDAVLVVDKGQAEKVKDLVEQFKAHGREIHINGQTTYRPWGNYTTIDSGDGYLVKRIVVNPGGCLSLQYHHHRSEHWTVVRGEALVTCDKNTFLLTEDQSTYIPLGAVHRLENHNPEPLYLIEVQSGDTVREDDIVRLEDVYGREKESVESQE